jgi:predicted metal-dependent hydrolase
MTSAAVASEENRAPRAIPVRRLAFDFERMPRQWFGGDPFLTHLAHALSLTFPEGERFFMDAVRHYEKRITSPALRHEISRFLGQEALHARAHASFNEWIRTLGLETEPIETRVREGLARARERSPRYQLAMTCALEHFTAMMAELLLDNEELREMMHPEARKLLVWHAIEETEHKAVAFDTYVAVGGTYRLRAISMLVTTLFFMATAASYQEHLMRRDPAAAGPMSRVKGFVKLWVQPGWFLQLVPAYLDYFRPGFHPWQREPKSPLEPYLREMQSAVVKA